MGDGSAAPQKIPLDKRGKTAYNNHSNCCSRVCGKPYDKAAATESHHASSDAKMFLMRKYRGFLVMPFYDDTR